MTANLRAAIALSSLVVVFLLARSVDARTYEATLLDSDRSTRVTAWGVSGEAQVGQFWVDPSLGPPQSLLWPMPSAAPISLHPAGFEESEVWDIAGSV